jgi:hypothetical protein
MSTAVFSPELLEQSVSDLIQPKVNRIIDDLLNSLPDPKTLTSEQRRGMIARYTAVLEGNFIYWMTAALLAVQSDEARPIILDNLHEEVRDSHPAMLRRFTLAARAYPSDSDMLAVDRDLTNVRLFLGELRAVPTVLTMAFFEGFIQRFMPYLAELAAQQGSQEREYTDVHGVCDIEHTQGLYNALRAELALAPVEPSEDLYRGVYSLRKLIQTIIDHR